MKQLDKHAYGPWALVTCASAGIGHQFARQASASGIDVVLVARREEQLKEVAVELRHGTGFQARVVPLDLGRGGILGPVREATCDLDIGLVISNAGAGTPGPFIAFPHERLRAIVHLNVITHLDLAHHFGQQLAARGRGGMVLVSALAGAGGLPFIANDSATKAYSPNTSVIARIGLGEMEAISPEQAVEEALTALVEKQVSTLPRANMSGTFEGMKDAVVEMIKTRLAAAQPAD